MSVNAKSRGPLLRIVAVLAGLFAVVVIAATVFVLVRARAMDEKLTFSDEPAPAPAIHASQDPAVVARGRSLVYGAAHCSQCHGDYARERPQDNVDGIALSGGIEFPMGPMGTMRAPNLTPAGIAQLSDDQLARAIATGVQHDGTLSMFMRYSAANLSHEDLTAVISFLRSLSPVDKKVAPSALTTLGKAAFSFFAMSPDRAPLPAHVPESDAPSLERGAYVAEHVALCIACHTPYDATTFTPNGPKGSGGVVERSHGADSDKEYAPPNLTSSPTGITGRLDEEQFVARMRQGRAFPTSLMPWESFTRMSESDMRSVYRYLRSLPPIDNDTGPAYRDAGWQR